jgi:uncharacterized protein (DUF1684 family)
VYFKAARLWAGAEIMLSMPNRARSCCPRSDVQRRFARACLPVIAIAFLSTTMACTSPTPPSYEESVQAARQRKDETLRTAADSPIPPDRRAALLPLRYFPPDSSYRVAGMLKVADARSASVNMPTSAGKTRAMVRVGVLEFNLKGKPLTLGAFVEEGSSDVDHLFVPFTDLTTGTETYPGGRYLDLTRTPTGIYEIDFNLAYNPYCYYNPTYDCPYPPAENRLPLPVRAGEKTDRTAH